MVAGTNVPAPLDRMPCSNCARLPNVEVSAVAEGLALEHGPKSSESTEASSL